MKEKSRTARKRVRDTLKLILEKLLDAWEEIRWIPGAILDYCMEHTWAEILLTIVVSILASLLTLFLLAFLMAKGWLPYPWWG